MAITDAQITDKYAVYNGDSCEVLPDLPSNSVGMGIHSPPFFSKKGALYEYSSSPRDLSNCRTYEQSLEHYEFIVSQMARIIKPGRLDCVHCVDVPSDGHLIDLPGDIIRLYEKHGFVYHDRKVIWKEPLRVAIRTRALELRHSQIVKDSSVCRSAGADYVLAFRKKGENKEPIQHPTGFTHYAGETDNDKRLTMGQSPYPQNLEDKYRNWEDPKTNKFAHWIWQHYASAVWMDIRISNKNADGSVSKRWAVLPYMHARESDEEKHIHPLQLDVIERCLQLWSNPGDTVLTPFAGVGSEVFQAVESGRRGIGIELKASYYRQMVANLKMAGMPRTTQEGMFEEDDEPDFAEAM